MSAPDCLLHQVLSTVGTNYGLSLQKLGKNHEALASYDRALSLQPTNAGECLKLHLDCLLIAS